MLQRCNNIFCIHSQIPSIKYYSEKNIFKQKKEPEGSNRVSYIIIIPPYTF